MAENFEYRYGLTPNGHITNANNKSNDNPEDNLSLKPSKEQITNPDNKSNDNPIDKISSKSIEGLNFGYTPNQPKNEKLLYKFNQDAKGNNSIEGQLMQNEQIQLLLSEILTDYKNYIGNDKDRLKILIKQEKSVLEEQGKQFNEDQSKIIESMYEYMLDNDNETGFENFIMTNGIYNIKTYLSNHIDKDGNFKFYSKNEIKARLKVDWFINLYKGYREKHAENSESLGKLEQEMKQFNGVASYVKNSIDIGIQEYLSGKYGKDGLAQYLNKFLLEAKNNENLKSLLDGKDKNSVIGVIRYGIKEYARLLNISDKNPQLGDSNVGDKVFNMQIRSYLYLYGIISHSKDFNPDNGTEESSFDPKKGLDDKELGEILRSILMADGVMKNDGKNKYLKSESKLQNEQMKKDIERRKSSRERINSAQNRRQEFRRLGLGNVEKKNIDIQNATGVEIAQNNDLGNKIVGFDRKNKLSETNLLNLQRPVLIKTGKDFILENKDVLSQYMNINDVVKFFDVGENGVKFNINYRESRISKHPEINSSEANKLMAILQGFPYKFEDNLSIAIIKIDKKMDNSHETIKNYAIGAVIDNIKDMFQNIVDTNTTGMFMNGFEFDENNSTKLENNCLILSGRFSGETVTIKYDLKEGKLYMNSFINITDQRITITGSSEPINEIGELQPFDRILDEFYKAPTESMKNNVIFPQIRRQPLSGGNENTNGLEHGENQPPRAPSNSRLSNMRNKIRNEHKIMFQKMCGTKIDEIGWEIRNKIEFKSSREPVALNLFRSLGVMPEDNGIKNLVGGDTPSDLYKIVQLIISDKNTPDDINKFSDYMKTIFDYIGLNWGQNTDHQDKTRNISKIIFDENINQDYITKVRDNTKNFDTEYNLARGKAQFGEGINFGILKLIEDNFTEGVYPNRKFSSNSMETFMEKLSAELDLEKYTENLINLQTE